jgi:uncharacterized glyoxalase superfamily protein PhnB
MTKTLQPRIHPAMRYQDARRALDWLTRAFGFETRVVHDGPDGSVAHAEMTFGASVIGFSSAHGVDPNNPWTMVKQGIYVSVTDVDAHHSRAAAAGAEIVRTLRDEDYGSRDYSARDLDGHLWGFGTYRMIEDDREQAFSVGLHYGNGDAALDWLARAFGFCKTLDVRGKDGVMFHGEMRYGADALMLDCGPKDEKIWGALSQYVNVHVEDPDAHHARATAAGAKVVTPLRTTEFGARGYLAQDVEGFLWNFTTYRPAP